MIDHISTEFAQFDPKEAEQLLNTEQLMVSIFGLDLIQQLKYHYAQNDKAHLWDHPLRVCTVAMQYAEFTSLPLNQQRSVMFATISHDAMLHFGRPEHHFTGAGYTYALLEKFDTDFIDHQETYFAVLEHRASWKQPRTRLVSQIVAAADRGKLEFWSAMKRAIHYRLGKRDHLQDLVQHEFEGIVKESLLHLIDKYGENGYGLANAPALYFVRHQDEIMQFREAIYDKNAQKRVLENNHFCAQFWIR